MPARIRRASTCGEICTRIKTARLIPRAQVNQRGCARGRKRAPRAAAVTTREPKQGVWGTVAAHEVQTVMRAAPLSPANLHFAVKEIAEIAGGDSG